MSIQANTIAAIATPPGTGGLSVIRVSGPDAFAVCDRIFKSPRGKLLAEAKTHTLVYGHIVDPAGGQVLDEVLAAVLCAPHSFTTEDTVELSCHGGTVVTREVLAAVLHAGAVLAGPGEFTKRAFMGGRLDLSQAEAVMDVIAAKTPLALQTAAHQLDGALSAPIGAVRDSLLDLSAQLGVMADYPEEDLDETGIPALRDSLRDAYARLDTLQKSANAGRLLRDGIDTVIAGKPNVGKSSLLNALLGHDRAIVTDVAGTTRDVICESADVGGAALNIFDTAGIRAGGDEIERLGMERARQHIREAELVLVVVDAQRGLDAEDEEICRLAAGKRALVLVNKCDVAASCDLSPLADWLPGVHTVHISAKLGTGLDTLKSKISDMFALGELVHSDGAVLTNLRHREAVAGALDAVGRALDALDAGVPADLVGIDILAAISALGEVTGQSVSEEVVDRIFHRFCVGK